MSTNRKTRRSPGRAARGISWALAAALSLMLTFALAGAAALYVIQSQGLHERVASNEELIRQETEWARDKIRDLAEEYGFEADRTLAVLDREMLARRNLAGLTWIRDTVNSGKPKQGPKVDNGEIEEMLSGLLRFPNLKDQNQINQAYGDATAGIVRIVGNATFFFRSDLTDLGLEKIRNYADIRSFLNLVNRLPLILGILAAIIAGLMILLVAGDPREALKYAGCSLGGAGILTAISGVLIVLLDLPGAAAAANGRLATMIRLIGQELLLPLILTVVLLLAAYGVCLTFYSRRNRRPAAVQSGTEGAAAEMPAAEGIAAEMPAAETSEPEEPAAEGTLSEGTISEGTPSDETSSDETPSEEISSEETPSEGRTEK
ncbi:MAG: hypothetical protein J6U01_03650 [Clostridia bacterium]|nr:hypothetical protein [Clostridia bacterium]